MPQRQSCKCCRDLQEAHDRAMDEYIDVVEQQSRLFRKGQCFAARDLDSAIQRMKARRQIAIDALLRHQANHYQLRAAH